LSSNVISLHAPSTTASLPANFPHGGGVEAAARLWQCDTSEVLDLSTGLHPAGAPNWLAGWLKEHASLVAHYPDVHAEPARTALACEFGVEPENVLITAGAQAAIETVFQAFGWSSIAIQTPCYSEPVRCAERSGCAVIPFQAGDDIPGADMLWWTSPHNPTGSVAKFPEGFHGVLDESYMPFSQRRDMRLLPGVMRIGSLTKTFCIPGLRLGYVIASSDDIRRLKLWMPPWPAPTIALHLLPELLPQADERDAIVSRGCIRLTALLAQHGWEICPSTTSFVLARPNGDMPDFASHRILARTFPEWPELAGWFRFGIPGDAPAWQRLEEALCP